MPVQVGNRVRVDYEGSLADGTVFDSTKDQGKPFEFEVGSGQLIKGFENAIVGMDEGEEKKIILQPDEAYGAPNPALTMRIPADKFPSNAEIRPGMTLALSTKEGKTVPARIVDITGEMVIVDLNHPLAGLVLNFWIKVIEILA